MNQIWVYRGIAILGVVSIGYGLLKPPEVKIEIKEVEKVVYKDRIEFKDRIVYKDRTITKTVQSPNGTVITTTTVDKGRTEEKEGVENKTITKTKETDISIVERSLPRYGLEAGYYFNDQARLGIDTRLGDLPLFIGVSALGSTKQLEIPTLGLGLRWEF